MDHIKRKFSLAIMDTRPLTRLGMELFILNIAPKASCTAQSGSVLHMFNALSARPVNVLVTELQGSNETALQSAKLLLQLCNYLPQTQVIVYTYTLRSDLLTPLQNTPQVSLIARQESLIQTRRLFKTALQGVKVISPIMMQSLCSKTGVILTHLPKRLSPREKLILQHLFDGLNLSQISSLLDISIKTTSAHKCSAMRKLGVRSDLDLYLALAHF